MGYEEKDTARLHSGTRTREVSQARSAASPAHAAAEASHGPPYRGPSPCRLSLFVDFHLVAGPVVVVVVAPASVLVGSRPRGARSRRRLSRPKCAAAAPSVVGAAAAVAPPLAPRSEVVTVPCRRSIRPGDRLGKRHLRGRRTRYSRGRCEAIQAQTAPYPRHVSTRRASHHAGGILQSVRAAPNGG